MPSSSSARKASPPRPTLLVGDLAACHRTYADLYRRVTDALASESAAPRAVWADMVPRFRALRESIVHLDERGPFSLQAYELAADCCWRARDWGEFLKCVQQLLDPIYPRFFPQAFQTQLQGEDSGAGLREEELGRLPEFTAAHILYFSCILPKPDSFEVAVMLRRLPAGLLRLPTVQGALRVASRLFCGEAGQFLWGAATLPTEMLRTIAAERAGACQAAMLAALAGSLRSLPAPVAVRLLRTGEGAAGEEALLGLLRAAAEGGSKGAAAAVAALQAGGFEGAADGGPRLTTLAFK